MAFVMADDRLFATPHDRRRTLEFPRRERDQRLHVEIFAAAERAANLRVANDDMLGIEREHLGDLAAIFVEPLSGGFHDESVAFVVRDPGVGLQIRVLLPRRRELALDDGRRARKRGIDVAAANAHVLEDRLGIVHRLARVVDDRQIFVLDAHRKRSRIGGFLRFTDDERDAIAVKAHDVIAEQRLIGGHEPVAVMRHVFRGEHGDDTRHTQRSGRVDREDACVRAMCEDDFQTQMLVADEIGRILRGTGHLPVRIGAWQRLADHTCASAFAASLASIIASRILR